MSNKGTAKAKRGLKQNEWPSKATAIRFVYPGFKNPFMLVFKHYTYYTNIICVVLYYLFYIFFIISQCSMSYVPAVLHPYEVYLFHSWIYLSHSGGNI